MSGDVNLLIGLPSYAPGCVSVRAQMQAQRLHPTWKISHYETAFSLLNFTHNAAWAFMLNHRHDAKLTHYLNLHADVRPCHDDWLGVLVSEMARVGADILSVIIPIKSDTGDPSTSTALESDDPWQPTRLSLSECARLEPTWTHRDLLWNTGCVLFKVGDWMERVWFASADRIVKTAAGFQAQCQPEDWSLSRACRRLGLNAFVTRAIGVEHVGSKVWVRT